MQIFFVLVVALSGLLPNIADVPAVPEDLKKIDLNLTAKEFAFTFFDMDKGDVSIIQGENGSTILINAGASSEMNKLKKWLAIYGVKKIDAIILTETATGYDDNVKEIIAEYHVPRMIAGKNMMEKVSETLRDFPEVKTSFWGEQSKETLLDEVEISVIHENAVEDHNALDLSIKIKNNYFLYITSASERLKNKLMKLAPSRNYLIKAPISALSIAVAEYLDPRALILHEYCNQAGEKEMIETFNEMWTEVFNTAKQGTVTAKFTETNHEIFPVRNLLNTSK
jgi:competence protein ComEC